MQKLMKTPLVLFVVACASLAGLFPILHAQTSTPAVRGRVVNGTTNQPVANIQVDYIQLQQGMTPAATVATDPQGRFRFPEEEFSGGPGLLRVEYQGATYTHAVSPPPSRLEEIELRVFEASREPGLVTASEHFIFLNPVGDALWIVEQVVLVNRSVPPRTYVNPEGTYPFTLPAAPREGVQVSVEGSSHMPINQTPIPRQQANSFAISYPIRPGETQVRLEYALPYTSPYDFSKALDQQAERTDIVTPGQGVQIEGETLSALGTDPTTGFIGYQVTPVGSQVRLRVSGQSPPRTASAGSAEESGSLAPIPDPASQVRWWILALAGLVMFGGFLYHYKR